MHEEIKGPEVLALFLAVLWTLVILAQIFMKEQDDDNDKRGGGDAQWT